MYPHVTQDIQRMFGNEFLGKIKADFQDVMQASQYIANHLLYTCYMGTTNSSRETRQRAKQLANEIGSYHLNIDIDSLVSNLRKLFSNITGKTPRFKNRRWKFSRKSSTTEHTSTSTDGK